MNRISNTYLTHLPRDYNPNLVFQVRAYNSRHRIPVKGMEIAVQKPGRGKHRPLAVLNARCYAAPIMVLGSGLVYKASLAPLKFSVRQRHSVFSYDVLESQWSITLHLPSPQRCSILSPKIKSYPNFCFL